MSLPRALVLGALALLARATAFGLTFVSAITDDVGKPTGLTFEKHDGVKYLYVSDHNAGRVFRYNLNDGTRTQIGFPGRTDGLFTWPDAIAIDPATRDLYIADRMLHRVTRITQSGAFVMKWGDSGTLTNRFGHPNAGSAPGQFNGPQGLAIDAAGHVYVSEHENHRVQKFRVTQSGGRWNVETVATWGKLGSGPGDMATPYGITFDAAGTLWVADGFNSRLQRFTANGELLSQLSIRGANEPHLVVTWAAFAPNGDIYASITSDPNTGGHYANQWIKKFNARGELLGRWGTFGTAPGEFKLPFGIAIDPETNRAYVADWDNNRIQIFDLGPRADPPPPIPASRLSNLSARLPTITAGAGAATGFVVTGDAPKQLLVRAIGPGLISFGVSNPFANPALQVFDHASRVVAQNDDWIATAEMNAATERVGAFRLANGSRDAALLVTLPPGAYTAQIGGAGAGTTLLEVYDATPGPAVPETRLLNLSARGRVESGDGQMIAGFAIAGEMPKRVLIRGVGAGLAAFDVANPLADAVLRLHAHGRSDAIAQNDDWDSGDPARVAELATAANAVGAFALNRGSKDAALLVSLAPGTYTAIVSGANNTSGAALVEVYEVP